MEAATRSYQIGRATGLDHDCFPIRLWHKAKRLGVWNPQEIDFERDRRDWTQLNADEQDVLLRLSSLFLAGEESVTLDLLPLLLTLAREGRLEEEIYLTSFLFEEAKHVEVFQRFMEEVARPRQDLSGFQGESYRELFQQRLPQALNRLLEDPSPQAQARASVTYNLVVEGVVAETGYHAYHSALSRRGVLPAMQQAIRLVKRDESRHLAYGVFLLSRLVAEHGDPVWEIIQDEMSELLPFALGIVEEVFAAYREPPFQLDLDEFLDYASGQFQARIHRIDQARGLPPEEVFRQGAED
ncbi:MAG TPA: R2-like ligand-binding oxidase [Acidobacteriota bacterium]|nr:R2-like ligand-binding oxidase [Acidobacteriota bacterium]